MVLNIKNDKKIGVYFKIPNEYNDYLAEILEPIEIKDFKWLISNDEIYLHSNNELSGNLFNKDERLIQGERLECIIKNNIYYMIFVRLEGFYKDGNAQYIDDFKDFMDSDCQTTLSVFDSSYVIFWSKNEDLVNKMYSYAQSKVYDEIEYITVYDLESGKYRL